MVFIVAKTVKGKKYYSIAKYKKENGKIKQEIVMYIGDKEKLRKFHDKIEKRLEKK